MIKVASRLYDDIVKVLEKFLHLTVPRDSNNHKAKLLHSSSILFISFVLVLVQLGLTIFPKVNDKVLGYAANISPTEVIALTNKKRVEAGLSPLQENSALTQAAQAKGNYMIEKDFWAHVAPDGTQPWKFFGDVGYKYKFAGENLARDFTNANSAVEGWMASPTHKENMLSGNYREIGIAVVEGDLNGVDTTIVVQLFGTRYSDQLPTAPVAQVNPATNTPAPSLVPSTSPVPSLSPSPTPLITPQPSPTPGFVASTETSNQNKQNQILISPFVTTKGISLGIVFVLLVVLIIDGVIISRRRITRVGGRVFAHLAFLGMIIAIAIILKAGKII